MGQRLNIEIIKDEKVLSNAYYHWGAYTQSAAYYTKQILDSMDHIENEGNDVLYAVRLLETTGALLTDEEIKLAKERFELEQFEVAVSRNEGLISISEKGIAETENWEEGRVEINLDTEQVLFSVLSESSKQEFLEYDDEETYNELPVYVLEYETHEIPFDKFDEFNTIIEQVEEAGHSGFKYSDSDESDVIEFIG